MAGPRWRKLRRDVWVERRRILLMVVAIAVSLVGIGTVLGAHAILAREMPRNYLGTRPASAALELGGAVDPELVAAVRQRPGIAEAEAGDIVLARARVGHDWIPLLLFVIADFDDLRLNRFVPERGTWPPPDGTMLIERSAVPMLAVGVGGAVEVKTPHGTARTVPVSGLVHDPGLAPAWQEREGYGYITPATLAMLGEAPTLGELRVLVSERPRDARAIEATVSGLATWLAARGRPVAQARVPPPGRHPHQTQMMGVLFLMLTFSAMALVLSAVVVATSVAAMLARQVREIGVMKTIGARTAQIAGLYALLIAAVGVAAVVLALPVGVVGARGLAAMAARMLNLELVSQAIPWSVFAIQGAAGIVVPLVVAIIPIARGARVTVREAIDQHGAVQPAPRRRWPLRAPAWLGRTVVLALRNAFRRRARAVLTLALLAVGGAMFMTALDVSRGWEQVVGRVHVNRSYDVEVRLDAPPAEVARLRQVAGVRVVEPWGYHRAALWRPGQLETVRTYPDGSHGSLALLGPPADTALVRFPLLAGRWLQPADREAMVINHMVLAQAPGTRVGDRLTLSVAGRPVSGRVVGIVEEVGSPAAVYVPDHAFAAAVESGARVRMVRIATTAASPAARTEVIRALERQLAADGVGVESVIPLAVLRTAMGDHVEVLIRMLLAMAGLFAVVGALGLASTMGTNVLERTREIAVMKTIGATPGQIARLVVGEALVIGVASWAVATAVALPLTALVGETVGMLAFRVRLPVVVDATAVVAWLGLVVLVAVVATVVPARRASRLTVWAALGQV